MYNTYSSQAQVVHSYVVDVSWWTTWGSVIGVWGIERRRVHISLNDTAKTGGVIAGAGNLIISTSRFMQWCSAGKFAHRALWGWWCLIHSNCIFHIQYPDGRVIEVTGVLRQIIGPCWHCRHFTLEVKRTGSRSEAVVLMSDKIQRNTESCKDFIKTEVSATGLS